MSTDAKDRVQAIHSDLLDLTLHDGKKVKLELGGTVEPTPQIVRTMEGSSSITIPIYDPRRKFLRGSLGAEDWNAEIDGLWFRYLSTSGTLPNLTLTLEDREVAKIREFEGPVKVLAHRGKPNEVTRAEFIKRLVELANPALTFICPQLEEVLPIEKQKQADKAKEDAKEKRKPGVGAATHLKVKGVAATPAQLELGETAARTSSAANAPFRVVTALFAGLIDENNMEEPNVLQAEQELTGPGGEGAKVGTPVEEINGFLTNKPEWTGEGAIEYFAKHPEASPGEIAAAIQGNANGAADYDRFVAEAREWAETLTGEEGESGASSPAAKKPPSFEVAKNEDFWTAIQRLAKDVNFRAFVVGQNFFYFDELELARGQVRVAIDEDSDIEEVEIDFNKNKPVTEFKFVVTAKSWKAPPGSVVTVEDYGPASIGFGDAPPKKKSQKIGLSSARKANGGEGRGRYLVASIEAPLVEASDARKIKVTLKKPTAPLPEKRAESAAAMPSKAKGEDNTTTERIVTELERVSAMEKPYEWGGFDPGLGFDCSGLVSYALKIGGFLTERLTTSTLASFGEAGAGELITIYDHANTGDPHTEHTAIEVEGRVWESGGGSENSNPNGGAGEVKEGIQEFLSQFEIKRHPKGF